MYGWPGAEDHLAVAVLIAVSVIEEQLDFRWAALVELGCALFAEHLELQAIGVSCRYT